MYAIPATCSVVGMIFFHIAAFGCRTFKETYTSDIDYYYYKYYYTAEYHVGFWGYDNGGSCKAFASGVELEGAFKFGRFVGIVGALFIWAIIVVVILASFFQFPNPKLVFRLIGGCMGLIAVFSFLLLVGLAEAETLKLSGGGILAVLSALVWTGGAVSMFIGMNERKGVKSTATKPAEAIAVISGEAPTTSATTITATKDDEPEISVTDDTGSHEVEI